MCDYKLIALDLDGTLLNSKKELTARTAAALEAAAARGIQIVPTTGRFFDGMPQIIRDLPYLRYAITINGAQVQDLIRGDIIYRGEIPLAQAVEIMTHLDTMPVIYDCYMDNWGWMTCSLQKKVAEYAPDAHYQDMLLRLRTPVDELKAFLMERNHDVQKIQFFTTNQELRRMALEQFETIFPGTKVSSSVVNNVEINNVRANKGDALRALSRYLGLEMEQVIAFGDGLNDVSMLQAAGKGVAMANSCAEAMEAADCLTSSCDEDGVAKIIEMIL